MFQAQTLGTKDGPWPLSQLLFSDVLIWSLRDKLPTRKARNCCDIPDNSGYNKGALLMEARWKLSLPIILWFDFLDLLVKNSRSIKGKQNKQKIKLRTENQRSSAFHFLFAMRKTGYNIFK